MSRRTTVKSLSFCILFAAGTIAGGSSQAGMINIAMVPVGDPGNAADSTGYGSVSYPYSIGKYDITASQYAAFLNAVAAADPYGLYNSFMASNSPNITGAGIIQSGNSGSYTYSVVAGHETFPVNFVNWGNSARFANWLQNGQPTGVEGPGTTETGAYTLNGATSTAALMAVTRNPGATWVIPTEDEWYKTAYYKGGGTNAGYWLYPERSNSAPSNMLSATGTNNANFYQGGYTDPTNYLTPVGAFAGSPGSYGTFDEGGDVSQWNEAVVTGSSRGVRGGSFFYLPSDILDNAPSYDRYFLGFDPTTETGLVGFRVASRAASVPEPGSVVLLLMGALGFLLCRVSRTNILSPCAAWPASGYD